MDSLFYVSILVIFVLISLFDVLLLKWLSKKNNIINTLYIKNLSISVLFKVIVFSITIITPLILGVNVLDLLIFWLLLGITVSFFIFYKMFNVYYRANIKQVLAIFIPFALFIILLLSSPYGVRFGRELYIKTLRPNEIDRFCYSRSLCEPSLICEQYSGCTGDSFSKAACMATGGCRAKDNRY